MLLQIHIQPHSIIDEIPLRDKGDEPADKLIIQVLQVPLSNVKGGIQTFNNNGALTAPFSFN